MDLLSAEALRAMCAAGERVRSYFITCHGAHTLSKPYNRGLGEYAAMLAGRALCSELTDDDALAFQQRLLSCLPAFTSGALRKVGRSAPPSGLVECCETPTQQNAVWDSLDALLDVGFGQHGAEAGAVVGPALAKVMVPTPPGRANLEELRSIVLTPNVGRDVGGAELYAYELANGGVKSDLFMPTLLTVDLPLVEMGCLAIFGMLWLYSGSLIFTICACVQVFLGLVFAYGIYMLFCDFFGILNLPGAFICLGVAADDIFVFLEAFDGAIRALPAGAPLVDVVAHVLRDAGLATLVTSLTTAGAFFSSATSYVTAMRCFGLYCGLVVMCDWLLVVSAVPALAVLYHKHLARCCGTLQSAHCANTPLVGSSKHRASRPLGARFAFFLAPMITHKYLRYLWVVLTGGAAIALGTQLISPGLVYPTSGSIELLASHDPIERYEQHVAKRFHAGAQVTGGLGGGDIPYVVTFTWGVVPEDDGDGWDPEASGFAAARLTDAASFDLTSNASQTFLQRFCEQATSAPWFAPFGTHLYPRTIYGECLGDALRQYATMPCDGPPVREAVSEPRCCSHGDDVGQGDGPLPPDLFLACVQTFAGAQGREQARSGLTTFELAPIFFDPTSGTPRVVQLTFWTNWTYAVEHMEAAAFDTMMSEWTEEHMAESPPSLGGAGFYSVGELQLVYALELALTASSTQSTYIAVLLAGGVLLAMTRDLWVSLLATLCIGLILGSVCGVVVMCGWHRSLIESIIISAGIGMACDFAAHLGFAYRQANAAGEAHDREGLVKLAVQRMAPALTAAAASTGVMGAFMSAGGTAFTSKFGLFILVLVTAGWTSGLFFLLPLLAMSGPVGQARICGRLLRPVSKRETALTAIRETLGDWRAPPPLSLATARQEALLEVSSVEPLPSMTVASVSAVEPPSFVSSSVRTPDDAGL